ncbi:hypothetical protein HanRHA438_Chr13g0606721 [Helianthus annuus]|nr:hypothetical protein HanRHA438_Chr13g0606721 [Helianthus annuus]
MLFILTIIPVNSSSDGTVLVSYNHIRCNLSRLPDCIFTFAMNGPDQIFNNSRCYWIKPCRRFVIQKHLFKMAAKQRNYT